MHLLQKLLYHHQIVGISLKQVGSGPARWETVNLIGPDFTQVMSTTGTDAYKYGVSEINLPLGLAIEDLKVTSTLKIFLVARVQI